MNHATTNAWILLAVDLASRHTPASLNDIIGAADTFNHAIPLHIEIQTAIGWLMQEGFVDQRGNGFVLTGRGKTLMNEVESRTAKPFDVWDLLKQRFISANTPVNVADISEAEYQSACEEYYSRATGVKR